MKFRDTDDHIQKTTLYTCQRLNSSTDMSDLLQNKQSLVRKWKVEHCYALVNFTNIVYSYYIMCLSLLKSREKMIRRSYFKERSCTSDQPNIATHWWCYTRDGSLYRCFESKISANLRNTTVPSEKSLLWCCWFLFAQCRSVAVTRALRIT